MSGGRLRWDAAGKHQAVCAACGGAVGTMGLVGKRHPLSLRFLVLGSLELQQRTQAQAKPQLACSSTHQPPEQIRGPWQQ